MRPHSFLKMDVTEFTEVCRLCPSSGGGKDLLNVFDKDISFKYNIREVISTYAGIEISQHDLISKKICQRCCNILYKMFEFRLDALKQDKTLKEKCSQLLGEKGLRLPNTCITIKKEIKHEKPDANLTIQAPQKIESKTKLNEVIPLTSKEELKRKLHPSVASIYRNYPNLKLPTKCFERHMAPVVSFAMGEVETYFRKHNLDMKKFIYKPRVGGPLHHQVARKKTFVPEKQKTIAPLKISKKLLESHKESDSSSDGSYVWTTVSKLKKGPKRKMSSSGSEISVKSKVSRINQSLPVPESVAATSKPTISKLNVNERLIASSNFQVCVPEIPPPGRITPPPPADNKKAPSPVPSRDSRSPSPQPAEPLSDDSRDSFSTNVSTTSTLNKAEFAESFGLIPTVTATKSHKLLVCNLCGSVHHNAYELKKHTMGHMVCQFCKEKFQSIEAKQYHIDNSCQIKQIMNSSGPTVQLEKLHLNLDIRKKYKDAFVDFEVIPGLVEPIPLEHVIIEAASPPPPDDEDNVIVLSDDERQDKSADPLSGIPTPSANMPPPAVENRLYNTVSVVRPDIRIKNNLILNSLEENMTDIQLLRDLIGLFKSDKPATVETMSQTDLPANKDIKVFKAEGICEFKHLKAQLLTYKIPITMSNGTFQATFKHNDKSRIKRSMALWDDLPVVDATNKENTKLDTRFSTPSSVKMSQIQPLSKSSSVKSNPANVAGNSITNTAVPNTSGIVSSRPATLTPAIRPIGASNAATQSSSSVNINPINISNSPTPLLQNYALNMTSVSVSSNPIPIPRTYINSALNNIVSASSRTMTSINSSRPISTVTSSYNRSLSPRSSTITNKPNTVSHLAANSASNCSVVSTALNKPSPNLSFTNNVPPLTLITSARPTISHLPSSTSIYSSIPPSTTGEPAQPTGDLSSFLSLCESRTTNSFLNKLPSHDPAQVTVISAILPTTTVASTQLAPNILPPSSINNSTSSTTTVAAEQSTIQTTDSLPFTSGNNSTPVPRPLETSKFRVKSVWELQ